MSLSSSIRSSRFLASIFSFPNKGADERLLSEPSPKKRGAPRHPSIYWLSVALFYGLVLVAVPLLLSLSGCAGVAWAQQPLEVESVRPAGKAVAGVNQIVVRFDRPVVALGNMEVAPDAGFVEVEPAVGCEWRWVDTSALSCRVPGDQPLPRATRFVVTVRPPLRTVNGERLAAPHVHSFETERASIQYVRVQNWRGPTMPQLW